MVSALSILLFPLAVRHSYQWWKDCLNARRPMAFCRPTPARGEFIVILYCMILVSFAWSAFRGELAAGWGFRVGAALAWGGAALGFAALHALRDEYSFGICVREGFRLHTSGIYQCVRHPMRLGLALESLGLVLSSAELWSIVPWLLILFLQAIRTNQEEEFLRAQTQGEYVAYSDRVPKWNLILGIVRVIFLSGRMRVCSAVTSLETREIRGHHTGNGLGDRNEGGLTATPRGRERR